MKNIVFFGTGAVAAEYTSYIENTDWGFNEDFQIKGYISSDEHGKELWNTYKFDKPYLGQWDDYEVDSSDFFVIALANPKVKRKVVEEIKKRRGKFINLIHPSVIWASSIQIGEGNLIGPYAIIGPNVRIGSFNTITSQSVVSHDSIIGDYNFLATALLCGYTKVGSDNYFGIRSTSVPSVEIGNRNTIQAGMIIDKSIHDDSTLFYKYKEKILVVPKNASED